MYTTVYTIYSAESLSFGVIYFSKNYFRLLGSREATILKSSSLSSNFKESELLDMATPTADETNVVEGTTGLLVGTMDLAATFGGR
mmetsp:Transcript_27438/g.46378  ORF Transcript_27438/g.46378 Transcript_27438/m.46378 type:complete len:86 (+) Transcript_27438:845-1102(+)